jgi:hypothetical protein
VGGVGVLCNRSASITRLVSERLSLLQGVKITDEVAPDGPVTLTWKPLASAPETSQVTILAMVAWRASADHTAPNHVNAVSLDRLAVNVDGWVTDMLRM